ncbi:MAG: class II fructose-bisphosphate aldolase, partial [Methylobacteriaceae bacterium]|nr:class II fructose-bisphosphate aldolase [Methylobacteriaceae bacterium]
MPLSQVVPLLRAAQQKEKAVGAFNVGNMEMLLGVIRAAEETREPVILQIAEKRLPHSPLHVMAPMMVRAASEASVDIAVQLDHGGDLDIIRQAMDYGFTAVMFDGS